MLKNRHRSDFRRHWLICPHQGQLVLFNKIAQDQKAQRSSLRLHFHIHDFFDAFQLPPAFGQKLLQGVLLSQGNPSPVNAPGLFQLPHKLLPALLRHLIGVSVVEEEALQQGLQPHRLQLRKPSLRPNQPFQIGREGNPLGLAENEQGGKIFWIVQEFFTVLLRLPKPPVGGDHAGKGFPPQKGVPHFSRIFLICLDFLQLFLRGPVKIDVILMGTEAFLPHKLRREDFLVDGAAQIDIALPLGGRTVVGRGRGQGNQRHPLRFLQKGLQRLPPLAAQMMGLVQADDPHPGRLHRLKEIEIPEVHALCLPRAGTLSVLRRVPVFLRKLPLVMLHGAVQSLIGDGRDAFHGLQIVGKESFRSRSF